MARARKNPRGFRPKPGSGAQIVLVGERGKHTHLYNPHTGEQACRSGINAGRPKKDGTRGVHPPPQLYRTDATTITCYRCAKLASYNVANSPTGSAVPPKKTP